MILLKANGELKSVFGRMIKTMGVNVTWTGKFVVLNNFLILSGNVRSLIFNFDNRKVNTNVIELPDRDEDAEPVEGNDILTNVLNMTLYAFGKWGTIKGLKVDQDYNQLNNLFQAILKDMKIKPGFRDDYFRFYKNEIQMTYEEVVEAAIEEGKRKAQEVKEEEESRQREEGLGLWHKICWGVEQCQFGKSELTAYEKHASRLGNNFYRTGVCCAKCAQKMFMAVYPEGEEFPVETAEGKVYLARSYTCNQCNCFYTPRPGKLIQEGDVYTLAFGSDRDAYEDYQELLGRNGRRTTNYHFNEYEWERGKTREPQTIEEACTDLEDMTEEELLELDGKLQDGFYPPEKSKPYRKRIHDLLRKISKNREKSEKSSAQNGSDGQENYKVAKNRNGGQEESQAVENRKESRGDIKAAEGRNGGPGSLNPLGSSHGSRADSQMTEGIDAKQDRQGGSLTAGSQGRNGGARNPGSRQDMTQDSSSRNSNANSGNSGDEVFDKYQARMKVLDRMSLRQLGELRQQIQSEKRLAHDQKKDFNSQIDETLARREEESLRQKVKDCAGKPYHIMARIEAEIRKSKAAEAVKAEALTEIAEMKRARGQQEAEQMVASMPANMTRSQYHAFRQKLAQYQDVDFSPFEAQLEERGRQAQKAELDVMLRRIDKSERKGLLKMLEQLKEGFSGKDAAAVQAKVEERLRRMDEAAIDKICPNILTMTFDEAAEAYEKIEGGPFLPELKTNTLEMIDKRLTKIKMDECALLVDKLREDLKGRIKDTQRLHFYEVRKVMRGEWEEQEAKLAAKALNTYAADRSRYEYPILICDSSAKKNGKEGFLLTPDHIFYNSTFNSEKIPIRAIHGVEGNTGLLNRGIYLSRGNGAKTKIPGGIPAKELSVFAQVLDGFVTYLQEKPESRSISYLAKEKHEVMCCYRCGYTYREGNVCPKCGNQANK
jgi:hypothetical protein